MGGSAALAWLLLWLLVLWLPVSIVILLHHRLQFLRRMERDDAPRRDRYFFAGLGIASGALRLFAQLKIAEARKLHAAAAFQRMADFLEERLYHVLRFALVEADLLEQEVRELGF